MDKILSDEVVVILSNYRKNISLLLISIIIIAFFSSIVAPVSGDTRGDPIITVDGIGDDDWNPNLKVMDFIMENIKYYGY